MEVGLDFDIPFPTLKQIVLVNMVPPHIIKYGGPKGLSCTDYRYRATLFDMDLMAKSLHIPQHLKQELVVVSMGLYNQLQHWGNYRCNDVIMQYSPIEPIFNVKGTVDESRTWERYFEKFTRVKHPCQKYLQSLLHLACRQTLLPHIGTVLRKILIAEGAGATHLVGPRKEFVNGKLTVTYSFGPTRLRTKVPGRCSADEILGWLNETRWNNALFSVTNREITIELNPMQNLDTLKEYFNQLHLKAGLGSWLPTQSTEFIVLALKLLKRDKNRLAFLSETWFPSILRCFLKWPFLRNFIPLMTFFAERMDGFGYAVVFCDIVLKIANQLDCDVHGYGNLLLEFARLVPTDRKQELQSAASEPLTMETLSDLNQSLPVQAMNILVVQNPTLYLRFKRIIFCN